MGFFQNSADRLEFLNQMMERTDTRVDADISHRGANNIKSAIVACLGCKSVNECQTWLAEVDGVASPPDFCPNAQRLMRMNRH